MFAVVCESIQSDDAIHLWSTHPPTFPFSSDFFPVYFQACKGDSPVVSGVYTLSLCTFAPAAIFAGLSVKATGRYRPQMWVAWVIVLTAMGLLSAPTMNAMGRGVGMSLGYSALLGLGIGYVPCPFFRSPSRCPPGPRERETGTCV